MPYSPPTGPSVNFTATGVGYAAPIGNAVNFEINFGLIIYPAGIPAGSFGSPTCYLGQQYIHPYPFTGQPEDPPAPNVYLKTQWINVTGYTNGVVGSAVVSNYLRNVVVTGIAPGDVGSPKIGFLTQSVTNAYLPTTQTSFGYPFLAYRARELHPASFYEQVFGTALVRDRAQKVYANGTAPTILFGVPAVRDRAQRLYPFGSLMSLVGYPSAQLRRREVKPSGINDWTYESDRFGNFGNVYNKNRKVHPNGYVQTLFGSAAYVLNKARPIRPDGSVQIKFGTTFASHKIRSVHPNWSDGVTFGTPFARTRKVINLDGWGWNSQKFGIPQKVWSNLQTIKPTATYEQTKYGRPWVDQGRRYITAPSIQPEYVGTPFVSHRVRQIHPTGIAQGYFGTHVLETHFNFVRCWGTEFGALGTPTIRNVTPQIFVYGMVAYLPGGKPTVQLRNRKITVLAGIAPPAISAPFVAYRTRKIRPPTLNTPAVGYPTVMFDQSQLVPPQRVIHPPSVQAGAGIVPSWEWLDPNAPWSGDVIPFGVPVVKLHTVFVPSMGVLDKFGEPTTRSMVVFCDPGPATEAFGYPRLDGGTKWVKPRGIDDSISIGDPKIIGPQYVRAGEVRNVASNEWEPNDFHSYGYEGAPSWDWRPQDVGPVFGGTTRASNWRQTIYASGGFGYPPVPSSSFGTPMAVHNPQRVYPIGINAFKRGLHIVEFTGTKNVEVLGEDQSSFGIPKLEKQDYGPKTVYVYGIQPPPILVHRVELKTRTLHMGGTQFWSSPIGAEYVGPYLRVYPHGVDMSAFGTVGVGYKHRQVVQLPVVDDSEPWETSTAVKVKHAPRGYFIEGSSFGGFGKPKAGYRNAVVNEVGWEEFETGFSYVPEHYPGLSKVKSRNIIVVPINNFTEFGNATVG